MTGGFAGRRPHEWEMVWGRGTHECVRHTTNEIVPS
jgi:hypothetical protein